MVRFAHRNIRSTTGCILYAGREAPGREAALYHGPNIFFGCMKLKRRYLIELFIFVNMVYTFLAFIVKHRRRGSKGGPWSPLRIDFYASYNNKSKTDKLRFVPKGQSVFDLFLE